MYPPPENSGDFIFLKNSLGELIAPETSIFPLVSYSPKREEWVGLGTGFFIDGRGGFVTARHVFYNDGISGKHVETLYAVQSLPNGERILRSISEFAVHPKADIAFGYLGYARNHFVWSYMTPIASGFTISNVPLKIDDQISTFAFPRTTSEDISEQQQLFTFRGRWEFGKIIEYHPEGMGHLHKGEGVFQTNMIIDNGASGGPVLKDRLVVGVNSVGLNFGAEDQGDPVSGIVPISYLYDIPFKGPNGKKIVVGDLIRSNVIKTYE